MLVVAGILEELVDEAEPSVAEAFLKVPEEADVLDLPATPDACLRWLLYYQASIHSYNSERMIKAACQARLSEREMAGGAVQESENTDIGEEILWKLVSPENGSLCAWVAGESVAMVVI